MSCDKSFDQADDFVDPRVQIELERLNTATDEINKLEVDLDEARNQFRQLLYESTLRIDNCSKKLGSCIEKARPYYDARLKAKEALQETQKAAVNFERANSAHAAAKEMVYLAEEGLKAEGRTFDHAWQEMLNHATMRVNESESDRTAAEAEHKRTSQIYQKAEIRVQTLQKDLKRAITKSSYFKQAAEGPCDKPRPPFWQPIERFKWDAWKRLGNMPKHEAMNNYVEELKKIVETMSYNDNVETFLGSLGSFYDSVPVEDIEMLLGPVLERVRSQPGSPLHGSPFGSRETSPTRLPRELVSKMSSLETSPLSSMSPSPQPPDTDDEDEEFIDTVETTPHTTRKSYRSLSNSPVVSKRNIDLIENSNSKEKISSKTNGHVTNASPLSYSNHNGVVPHVNGNGLKNEIEENVTVNGTKSRSSRDRESPNVAKRRVVKQNGGPRPNNNAYVTDLSEPIREAVLHLQKDLDRITARVRSLEVTTLSQPQYFYAENSTSSNDNLEVEEIVLTPAGANAVAVVKKHPRWWPFPELSPRTAFFVIIWPFVAHYLIRYMQNRRRRY